MADITILVSEIGQSLNLSLKQGTTDLSGDNLTTEVDLNQNIIWKVNPNPDSGRNNNIILMHIKSADASLPKYSKSQQILVEADYAAVYTEETSGVITGTVVSSSPTPTEPGKKPFENYQIGWRKDSESAATEHFDDPTLRMK